MVKIEKGKLYLITGGSGFLGVPLCERVLKLGGRVRTIARDEGKLVDLNQKWPEVETLTGDIYDTFEIKQAMKGVRGVFHLAACKHVGIAEQQVRECIKSNTIGSMNILDESLETKPDFVLGVSTDKAAQVAGVYGASKLLMERLFNQFEELNDGDWFYAKYDRTHDLSFVMNYQITKRLIFSTLKYLFIRFGIKLTSSPPKTFECEANICSTRVVPERGIPTINIGDKSFTP